MTLCRWCLRSCHPSVALEERPNWGLLPKDPKVLLGMLNTLLNKKWNSNDSFDSNWSWSNVEFQLLTCDYHWWIQQVLCSFGPWTSRIFKLPDLRHFPMTWTAGQIVQRWNKINAPKVPCLSSSLLTKVELFQLGRLLSHAVESLCPYHPLFIVGAMETHLRCWRLLASYFFSIKTLTTARQGRSGGLDGFWTKLVHSEGPNSIETVQWITCYCLPFNDKKRINKHEIHVSLINDSWKQQWLKALFDYTSPTLGVNIFHSPTQSFVSPQPDMCRRSSSWRALLGMRRHLGWCNRSIQIVWWLPWISNTLKILTWTRTVEWGFLFPNVESFKFKFDFLWVSIL